MSEAVFVTGAARGIGRAITDIDAWKEALASFVGTTGGRLDVLINNAGVLAAGEFVNIPPERHKMIVDVNVTGVMYHMSQFSPLWARRLVNKRIAH